MKTNILKYLLFILSAIFIAGCYEFEEYDSEGSASENAPTLTMVATLGSNIDSIIVAEFTADKDGYLSYALMADSVIMDAQDLMEKNVADALVLKQIEIAENVTSSIEFKDLMPNTEYYIYAVASTQGYWSNIESQLVQTNDGMNPQYVSSSPSSLSYDLELGTAISITFSEPIVLDTLKKFTFGYYFEGLNTVVPSDSISVSGKTVTIKPVHSGYAGDYVYLSWEEGVVTDLAGNPCAAKTSGVIGGAPSGNFYGFDNISFDISDQQLPSTDSILAVHDFKIDIVFPISIELVDEITPEMVMIRYSNWIGTSKIELSAIKDLEIINDSILRITQPRIAGHGDLIELKIAEGVVSEQSFGNLNNESIYELAWKLGDFQLTEDMISPENGELMTSQMFDVEIEFDYSVSKVMTADAGDIIFTYTDTAGVETKLAATTYDVDPTNDSIFIIEMPQAADYGSTVSISIDENVISDKDGNVNLELVEELSWNVAELASSVDVMFGVYNAKCTSLFDGTEYSIDSIVISKYDASPTDTVWITGLEGGVDSVKAGFDIATGELSIPAFQSVGVTLDDGGILLTANHPEVDAAYVSRGLVLSTGDIIMTWGTYISGGTNDGYFNDVYDSFWTKQGTTRSTKLSNNKLKNLTLQSRRF